MLELWATRQSPFLSPLIHTCLFLLPLLPHTIGGFVCKVLPKCSPHTSSPGSQHMAPLAMGAAAMTGPWSCWAGCCI